MHPSHVYREHFITSDMDIAVVMALNVCNLCSVVGNISYCNEIIYSEPLVSSM